MTSISVIIPVRDRAGMLDACLEAVVGQLGDGDSVVVVDDGSTDGSGEVARRWATRAPVSVVDGHGDGAVRARRAGVAASDGDVLAFTDSDCVPAPGWLDAGRRAIDAGLDLAQGRTTPIRPAGLLERTLWVTEENGLFDSCNLFVRRTAYDAVGGFDTAAGQRLHFRLGRLRGLGFGEDSLFGWAVRRAGNACAFVPEAVVFHEVLAFDPTDTVRRAWQAGGFPALVAEIPELRDGLLMNGLFLGSRRRVLLYTATGCLVLGRRRTAAAAVIVWAGTHAAHAATHEPAARRRLAATAVGCATDAVTAVALVLGSIRSRSPVL